MAQPGGRSQVHVDSILTGISVAYVQEESNFIAGQIAPIIPVQKQSDKFFKWNKESIRQPDSAIRAPASESVGTGHKLGTDNYFCDLWAVHHDVPWEDRDNADNPLDLDRDALTFLMQDMLIRRDLQAAAVIFADSVYTGGTTGADISLGTTWNDVSSTPISDIADQQGSLLENTGKLGNVLVLGYDVYKALRDHEDLLDRIKYTTRGIVTADLMAALFDVDRVVVARASYNTEQEGNATNTEDFIFNQKDALLLYVNPSPSRNTPSAAYGFAWTGHLPNAFGIAAGRMEVPLHKATRIELEMAFDFKVVGADLGVKWDAAVA